VTAIRRPHPSVRWRLTLTYTALFVISGAALLGVSYVLVKHREKGPAAAVSIICRGKAGVTAGQTVVGIGPLPGPGPILNVSTCQHAVESSGTVFFHSGGSLSAPVSSGVGGIPGPTAAEVRQLTAAVNASEAHILDSFELESVLALALMTIVSLGLSWWIAGRVLRPVHRITDTARRLSERTLDARINMQGADDELKELADTFDAMLARLDGAFHSQRRFVANASHELRTPLATERVLIDEALANRSASPTELRAILEQLRGNSEETGRLIDALLMLARSESGIEHWVPVDLAVAAASVVEQALAEAEVSEVTVETDLEPVWVSGDPGLIERLVGNLVENAIRHNNAGGTVSVATARDHDVGVLQVTNTGPVVDAAAMAGLIEPFRRAGPDRSANDGGLGLGLSIVDAIVSAHQGTMLLKARPGGGLDIRVRLPSPRPAVERHAAPLARAQDQ
jgi:signal transduction histidine kinase